MSANSSKNTYPKQEIIELILKAEVEYEKQKSALLGQDDNVLLSLQQSISLGSKRAERCGVSHHKSKDDEEGADLSHFAQKIPPKDTPSRFEQLLQTYYSTLDPKDFKRVLDFQRKEKDDALQMIKDESIRYKTRAEEHPYFAFANETSHVIFDPVPSDPTKLYGWQRFPDELDERYFATAETRLRLFAEALLNNNFKHALDLNLKLEGDINEFSRILTKYAEYIDRGDKIVGTFLSYAALIGTTVADIVIFHEAGFLAGLVLVATKNIFLNLEQKYYGQRNDLGVKDAFLQAGESYFAARVFSALGKFIQSRPLISGIWGNSKAMKGFLTLITNNFANGLTTTIHEIAFNSKSPGEFLSLLYEKTIASKENWITSLIYTAASNIPESEWASFQKTNFDFSKGKVLLLSSALALTPPRASMVHEPENITLTQRGVADLKGKAYDPKSSRQVLTKPVLDKTIPQPFLEKTSGTNTTTQTPKPSAPDETPFIQAGIVALPGRRRRKTGDDKSSKTFDLAKYRERIAGIIAARDNSTDNILHVLQLQVHWGPSPRGHVVYITEQGQLIGSYRALNLFVEQNPAYANWDKHHLVEDIHLRNQGIRQFYAAEWKDLPCVLLPKFPHSKRIGSILRRADNELDLTSQELYEEYYAVVYDILGDYTGHGSEAQISAELKQITKVMLGL
jgi:hypothetical protein